MKEARPAVKPVNKEEVQLMAPFAALSIVFFSLKSVVNITTICDVRPIYPVPKPGKLAGSRQVSSAS